MIRALFLALVAVASIAAERPEDKDLEHIKNFVLLSTFQVRGRVDGKTETTTEVVHIPSTKKPDPMPVEEARPKVPAGKPYPVTVEKPYPVPVPVYIRVPVYVRVAGNHLEGLIGSYVPSKAGGTYRTGFNRYQTVEYQKTW